MVTNLERLIEALEYSQESDQLWHEIFDSKEEAESVLSNAAKEEPDEYQIASLLAIFENDITFSDNIEETYRKCIKKLKKEIRKVSS
jgi:GR25 family glycosyltransferase involved in LPS biosynthesis